MPTAVILGAGMVGSVMALDLLGEPDWLVVSADVREENLRALRERARRLGKGPAARLSTRAADLSSPAQIKRLVKRADVVLGALSSKIGMGALKAVIEAGKPYSDISFMADDAGRYNALAKRKGVTAVVDIGVAPGMSHLLAGHAVELLDECREIEIYVGGLPRQRTWPFEYKAAFSPADVIEEYTRPTRLVEHGREVVRPALSEPELMNFDGAGTLEAFNTDGLRSLVRTLKVPFMKEKTLRYPGHIELMRVMRETGLFSSKPVTLKGANGKPVSVRPLDLTSKLMFPKWTYQPGEEDLTVMRVLARGTVKGSKRPATLRWDLFDLYDRASQSTSMARTTALPCTIVARMLAAGTIRQKGVVFPERLARQRGVVSHVLAALAAKGVRFVEDHRGLPADRTPTRRGQR